MFFYTTALAFLVVFFLDERIEWAEALTMFLIYVVYAVFMKYNALIEYYVKRQLQGRRIGVTTQVNGNFTTAQQVLLWSWRGLKGFFEMCIGED